MPTARSINTDIWEDLYSGGLVINYPNDSFVRITHRLYDPKTRPRLLDYGFGSGQNMAHLLRRGFDVRGLEVSPSAARSARRLLKRHGLKGELKLTRDGRIPYPDGYFDGVVAWGVLEYNDWGGFRRAVKEIDRVMRPGGVFLGVVNAPGDFKHKNSRPLGGGLFALDDKTGQGGARVIIFERRQLSGCFPGKKLRIGHYEHSFGPTYARHWIVSYEK